MSWQPRSFTKLVDKSISEESTTSPFDTINEIDSCKKRGCLLPVTIDAGTSFFIVRLLLFSLSLSQKPTYSLHHCYHNIYICHVR